MAESTAIVTFETTEPLNFEFEDPLLLPSQLTLTEGQNYLNLDVDLQSSQEMNVLFDEEDLLSDPIIMQLCNGNSHSGFLEQDGIPENPVFGDQYSVPPPQYSCICCQILREITHSNGMRVKRLEIHGAFGIITHAVLRIHDCELSYQTQDCQMFDFDKESMQTVKKFLVQYYEICREEGYSPMQDPLSTFYEALSVGFTEPDNTNHFLQFTEQNTGDGEYKPYEMSNEARHGSIDEVRSVKKIPLAMQRQRTRNLGLKDFVDYFDQPIETAARKLNICPTVMKKICRKNGVLRWPFRKINSIEKKISKSRKILDASTDVEERARVLEDIQKYNQQLATIYAEYTN